jgi:plasmid stabilization system protein ParE
MKPVVFANEAEAELAEAIDRANEDRPGRGDRLRAAVEQSVARVQQFPGIGAVFGRTTYRKFLVRKFPYAVCYREFDDVIWIAAVAHAKRRPGYWLGRSRGDRQ